MNSRDTSSDHIAQYGSSSGKGKESASIASRIASSASGLAKNVMGSSSASDLSNSLSSGASMNNKIPNESSSRSRSQWLENLPVRPRGSGTYAYWQGEPFGQSFRSGPSQGTHNQDFEQFMNSSPATISSDLNSASYDSGACTSDFQHEPTPNGAISETSECVRTSSHDSTEHEDDSAVRMLLSARSLDPESGLMDVDIVNGIEEDAGDLFGSGYALEEQRTVGRMKSALPPPATYQSVSPSNALDLMPKWPAGMDHSVSSLTESDWVEALNNYTDGVWELETFLAEWIKMKWPLPTDGQSMAIGLDGQALSRLKMILGHIAEMATSESTSQHTHSTQHNDFEGVTQERASSIWETATTLSAAQDLFQNTVNDWEATKRAHGAQYQHNVSQGALSTTSQAKTHKMHRHPVRRDSPMSDQSMDEELSTPTFHCPWIRCHQRFNDPTELRLHTSIHTQYACPHEHCTAQFQSHEEWADHITGPHHDLLEHSFRTPITSEG